MLTLFSSCSKPGGQNFYFHFIVFVMMCSELLQCVWGGQGVMLEVLGVVTVWYFCVGFSSEFQVMNCWYF